MRFILPTFAAICLLSAAFFATSALAETTAQRGVAKERVIREAAKYQREQRYTIRRDGKTIRVTPKATFWLRGTTDADAEVTLRWQITVNTKPMKGTAGKLVCEGRVTVRTSGTGDVNDPTQMRASLAKDACIA